VNSVGKLAKKQSWKRRNYERSSFGPDKAENMLMKDYWIKSKEAMNYDGKQEKLLPKSKKQTKEIIL